MKQRWGSLVLAPSFYLPLMSVLYPAFFLPGRSPCYLHMISSLIQVNVQASGNVTCRMENSRLLFVLLSVIFSWFVLRVLIVSPSVPFLLHSLLNTNLLNMFLLHFFSPSFYFRIILSPPLALFSPPSFFFTWFCFELWRKCGRKMEWKRVEKEKEG